MSMKLDLIMSLVLFIILIVVRVIYTKQYKTKNMFLDNIFKKFNKSICFLGVLYSFVYICTRYFVNEYSFIDSLLEGLGVLILIIPFTITSISRRFNIDDIIFSKEITVKKIDKKELLKLKNTGINIKEDKKSNNDIKDIIKVIEDNRGKFDNYIRCIKFNIVMYTSIVISTIMYVVFGFPSNIYLSLSLLLKLISFIVSNLFIIKLPYDTDIMNRKVIDKNNISIKQEIFSSLLHALCISFGMTVPYLYFLAGNYNAEAFCNSLFLVTYCYSCIFLMVVYFSEKISIINLFKVIKSKIALGYILVYVIFSILVLYCNVFNTFNFKLRNYLVCILVAFVVTVLYDIVKFARYTSNRGGKKRVKHNKK